MKKILVLLMLLLLALPLGGCGAETKEITVVATFYPVYVLAENVLDGVEGVTLASMTPPSTGCLHDYQLLTADMRTLSSASALILNGAGMEDSFLPTIVSRFPDLALVNCAQGVALLAEGDGDDDGHDHGEYNAHIWLSPLNAIRMVENIRSAMAELLPGQADRINENAAQYTRRLQDLDAELTAAIAALPHKKIVTFHEAFPYFAQAYGLAVVAVVTSDPDTPLSSRMLSDVIAAVKEAGNPPLFYEPLYGDTAVRTVARSTGAPVYALDPLVTGDGALTAYEDVMRANLAVLQDALGQ